MTKPSVSGIGASLVQTMLCSSTTSGFALFVFALLELEPQHFDDSAGDLVRIALSASGLVTEDALLAGSVVLRPVVVVAVLWHVVVAVVPTVKSVLLTFLWAAVVQSDLVVLVVVHVLFWSPGLLHQVSSSFLAFLSMRVMPSELVLSRT